MERPSHWRRGKGKEIKVRGGYVVCLIKLRKCVLR